MFGERSIFIFIECTSDGNTVASDAATSETIPSGVHEMEINFDLSPKITNIPLISCFLPMECYQLALICTKVPRAEPHLYITRLNGSAQ